MPPVVSVDFTAALAQYQALLWRVCRLYCTDEDEQQDLYQEIMLQLWKAWPRYEGRAKLSTWLYRIALNVAISAVRERKRRPAAAPLSAATHALPAPAPDGPDSDELAALYRAIASLSQLDKALVLLYLEERPYEEIAEILGITANNARVKMHRAQDKLRHLLLPSK
ncbi:sigma-70 family RNA polymerase sigma factor [Hymenobacter saemangeumensis]|uniref:Sigma-70 family RNA polymerase sigma factor n=1 Tax=Hymenobacter saemangeumensis TaxID=1084522 RepID=A0ABP8I9Z0_9BACT